MLSACSLCQLAHQSPQQALSSSRRKTKPKLIFEAIAHLTQIHWVVSVGSSLGTLLGIFAAYPHIVSRKRGHSIRDTHQLLATHIDQRSESLLKSSHPVPAKVGLSWRKCCAKTSFLTKYLLLVTKGIATRSKKKLTLVAPGLTTRNKKLLVTRCNKDAIRWRPLQPWVE